MYQVAPYWLYSATPNVAAHASAGPCDGQDISQTLNLEHEQYNAHRMARAVTGGGALALQGLHASFGSLET